MLPTALAPHLREHLVLVKAQHETDLAAGRGGVALPGALRLKYPNAAREWSWQWVFPATRFYVDGATGERRRHHLHESVVQRSVKDAACSRHRQTGHMPHVTAFVCHAPAGSGV
jgi:hypothetical protein